jgi:hypothetical protein
MGKGLGKNQLMMMIDNIYKTKDRELTCSECQEALDLFAEQVLAGKNPEEAIPLVQDHITKCGDCREEFEALLTALETLE